MVMLERAISLFGGAWVVQHSGERMRKLFRTSSLCVFMAIMVTTIGLGGLFAAVAAEDGPASIPPVSGNVVASDAVTPAATVTPVDTDAIVQEIIRIIIKIIESILTTPTVTPTNTATATTEPTPTATSEPTPTATTEPTPTATTAP